MRSIIWELLENPSRILEKWLDLFSVDKKTIELIILGSFLIALGFNYLGELIISLVNFIGGIKTTIGISTADVVACIFVVLLILKPFTEK